MQVNGCSGLQESIVPERHTKDLSLTKKSYVWLGLGNKTTFVKVRKDGG